MKRFRSILDVKDYKTSSTAQLFKQLDRLPINIRTNYFEIVQMHNIVHGTAPSYLKELFKPVSEVHTYNTRSNGTNDMYMYVPRYTLTTGQRSFKINIEVPVSGTN